MGGSKKDEKKDGKKDGKKHEKKEESCMCFAEARTSETCGGLRNITHPLRYYEFTQEEMKALEECDRESFYGRCLPFSAILASLTYAAIKNGNLKPNPRFGPFPKVTLAVMVGYFLGKLSYQQACAEKLMALPGSYIGQLLRERKEGKFGGGRTAMSKGGTTMLGANPGDIYSDAGPGSSLDLDTDRPLFNEEAYRPGASAQPSAPDAQPKAPGLSYEDLRRKNRDDHKGAKQEPYRTDLGPPPPVQRMRPVTPAAPTNKYGDVME
ncbi:hypothetical protein PYW07_000533 [Mythimna separata]|uniref:OCIA domain-containing protein n=1 Tax=Mythimna separata TaxID=271217 RepID=A0AAD8E1I7_MYTSE|nr:hypothetical protein PYW07_000533 [Mythimna separata]